MTGWARVDLTDRQTAHATITTMGIPPIHSSCSGEMLPSAPTANHTAISRTFHGVDSNLPGGRLGAGPSDQEALRRTAFVAGSFLAVEAARFVGAFSAPFGRSAFLAGVPRLD
jgi:hypothetical protein